MKFTVTLFAILAIFGLSQAHQVPDFGEGPLHEDIQEFLDLLPFKKIGSVVNYYRQHDPEVQKLEKYLKNTTLVRDLWVDFQAVPEVLNLFNYLQNEGIQIYNVVNVVNRALNIKELVPPEQLLTQEQVEVMKRKTGGLAGLSKQIKKLVDADAFISLYAKKLQTSEAFVNFISELKSENFYQLVNKVYRIRAVQTLLNILKQAKVNVAIVGDLLYVVLGVKIEPKTLNEELLDFYELLPVEDIINVIITYVNEDEKVQEGIKFMFTPEFHALVRAVEDLKEFDELVLYFERMGYSIIEDIQKFHELIGMEGYVPPKVENILKYVGKPQKVGEGMIAMIKDVYALLPLDKIDALYEYKVANSKVFAELVKNVTSEEFKKIVTNLSTQEALKQLLSDSKEKGLEIASLQKLSLRMIGLVKTPPF